MIAMYTLQNRHGVSFGGPELEAFCAFETEVRSKVQTTYPDLFVHRNYCRRLARL